MATSEETNIATERRYFETIAEGPAPDVASKGTTMRARFAIFFEFRNGQIARQRNYDCFDPW